MDHLRPPEGHARDGVASGYGFFIAKGSPEEEAAQLAEVRERLGDEAVDRFQDSRERRRHPRPLTGSEREVINEAAAPVLRDLEASGAIVPEILFQSSGDESGDGFREGVSTNIARDGGHGGNVWIPNVPSIPISTPLRQTPTAGTPPCGGAREHGL